MKNMRVAFVSEYFPPFTPGGAEWSTFYLAQDLVKKGYQVFVITPNYDAKKIENINGLKIIRFPFINIPVGKKSIPEYYFLNPFWFLWAAWFIFMNSLQNKVDIIHVHGKY